MELRSTKNGWVEVFDEDKQSINFHRFTDACAMEIGEDFVVVCKNGGWIEVYDTALNLISSEVFLNIKEIKAEKFITVTLKNGWSEVYDKWFNMQSVKYCGD
ncbi:hypothetical protein QQ020_08140 [Fulvivirgaceae bacterium BMA12]|uniref:Uncharacterized protein n=1 Tax=Agaribacillus aureus TaxID=3051825 RepID=A0ABT8L2N6_9BACT|nr:hypothetical protein [Fulvivirgaceae bacterium BMA12]